MIRQARNHSSMRERWRSAFGMARATRDMVYGGRKTDPYFDVAIEYAESSYDRMSSASPGKYLAMLARKKRCIESGMYWSGFMSARHLNCRCTMEPL